MTFIIEFNCIFFLECSNSGPIAPTGSTNNFDGSTAVGTTVIFTCLADRSMLFASVCQSCGGWSEVTGSCPEIPEAVEGINVLSNDQCVFLTSSNFPNLYPVETKTWDLMPDLTRCRQPRLGLTFVDTFDINGRRNRCNIGDRLEAIHSPTEHRKLFCNWRSNNELPVYTDFRFRNGESVAFTWNATQEGRGFKLITCVVCS